MPFDKKAPKLWPADPLKLTLMDSQDNPDIGDNWTILKTASPPTQDLERYRVAMLPGIGKDKYFNLEYVQVDGGIELQATVNAIDDLFDKLTILRLSAFASSKIVKILSANEDLIIFTSKFFSLVSYFCRRYSNLFIFNDYPRWQFIKIV